MDIQIRRSDNSLVLEPEGIINIQSSPYLREVILKEFGKGLGRCIINLSKVTYMDSSGLATLVEGLQIANQGGGLFGLCAIEEQMIKDLLEMTHLTEAFPIFDTEESAVTAS